MPLPHDPERELTPPEELKLRMGRRESGDVLAFVYVEYEMPTHIAGTGESDDLIVQSEPASGRAEHVLAVEVFKTVEEAAAWFETARETQPWLPRH